MALEDEVSPINFSKTFGTVDGERPQRRIETNKWTEPFFQKATDFRPRITP